MRWEVWKRMWILFLTIGHGFFFFFEGGFMGIAESWGMAQREKKKYIYKKGDGRLKAELFWVLSPKFPKFRCFPS